MSEKNPTAIVEQMRAKHEQRMKSKGVEPPSLPTVQPYQLPMWPNTVRSLPNAFARGALFTVGNHRAPRRQFKKEKIASVGNIEVLFTGEELRQGDDGDVFLQALHLAREKPVLQEEPTVEFTAGSMIRALGWAHNKRSYERLKACLERMQHASVEVKIANRRGFLGSMVRKAFWEEEDGTPSRRWKVYFEPEIVSLFGPDDYSRLQWELRLTLTPMEKWLHSFYATHEKPFPYRVSLLRDLCGAATSELRGFRRTLRSALHTLVEKGFLRDFQIDADVVHVTRANVVTDTRVLARR